MVKRYSVNEALGAAGLCCALALSAVCANAQTFAGRELVAATSAELSNTIETRRAEFEADPYALYGLVDTLLLPRFDMQRGSRGILAQHWADTSAANRDRFVTAFYNYLVASYGKLLLQFKRDTLQILPFDGDPNLSPARVKSVLTMTDGTKVNVDFVMVDESDGWKVVDVVAEGVSYVKTYRSQFSIDIETEGLDSVLEWLDNKGAARFLSDRP
jgi:phospholipid transport system substrate-binding protein